MILFRQRSRRRPCKRPSARLSCVAVVSLASVLVGSASVLGDEIDLLTEAFDGDLRPGWSWVREDASGWRLTDGALEIRVRPGNLWGSANDAGNVLVRELPSALDTAFEVSVSNSPSEQWEQAGIAWYVDDSHMVKLVKERVDGETWVVMGREERDRTRTIAKLPLATQSVRLRIEVRGERLTGRYRPLDSGDVSAARWQEAGACELPRYAASEARVPMASLQVYNGPRDAEHWARFSSFRMLGLESSPTIAGQVGVNIHFTGAPERDLDLIARAGFGWVRMDLVWQAIEREEGVYRWKAYDELVDGLAARGIRALFILDYSNKLYETARSVRTPEGRAAFARFAGAAAARFRGRGVRWEIWNEPNLEKFWTPEPSASDYLELVRAAVPAIRAADPQSKVLGPATSGIPHDYLEPLFAGGFLELVDEVSVHPYRGRPPETVLEDYAALEELIRRHTPAGETPRPIVSGEWGWSNRHWGREISPELQGMYLARQFLVNASAGVRLSIWYDWANDGPDPRETEHNFGTVTLEREPKPAWLAAHTLMTLTGKLRFARRIESAESDFLLLFSAPTEAQSPADTGQTLAAWTTSPPHRLRLTAPELAGAVEVVTFDGREKLEIEPSNGTLELDVGPGPRYATLPSATAQGMRVASDG